MGILQEGDDKSKYELHQIAPGVWGRNIPPEERILKPEQIEKLANESGSQAFGEYIRELYAKQHRDNRPIFNQAATIGEFFVNLISHRKKK